MPPEKMEPFKFRVRPSMLEQAQAIADKRGDNLSEVLRDGLKDYIRQNAHLLPDAGAPADAPADVLNDSKETDRG